jgi:hypothetical protein
MKKKWRPIKLERRVQGIARHRATKQLMQVPWGRFHRAYEEYLRWEALALWLRAVVETEGSAPSWLAATLKKRCPGFIENQALLNEPRLLGFRFHEWIHNQIFGLAKQEGWLDALLFYGVRDLRSQNTWAYWEHCDQEWHRRRPPSYPNFDEWLRLARNYNRCQQASVASVADAVEQYVEWKAFICWFQPVSGTELARHVASQLQCKCPGFLEPRTSGNVKSRDGKTKTGRDLIAWIEDRFFAEAKKAGWFDIILRQARSDSGILQTVEQDLVPESNSCLPFFRPVAPRC